jgi:hypothetical protein
MEKMFAAMMERCMGGLSEEDRQRFASCFGKADGKPCYGREDMQAMMARMKSCCGMAGVMPSAAGNGEASK